MAAAILGVLVMAGCAGNPESPSESPSLGIEPTGAPIVIEPIAALDGAERYEFEGLGIDVPAGMVATSQVLDDGSTQVQLHEEAVERAAVIVTVTPQEDATSTIVDATSDLTAIQVTASGVSSNLVRAPVTWEGMTYAVAITTDLAVETAGVEEAKEGIIVTLNNPDETQLVAISAEAMQGELEASDAYSALRTLRFDG